MILPTKGISADRALLTIGAEIIALLRRPMSVSEVWEAYKSIQDKKTTNTVVTFDWFTLALSMLFALGAISQNSSGRLELNHVPA